MSARPRPAIENSSAGLFLLEASAKVVVTREEHHQAALHRYRPRGDGQARRVAAELGYASISDNDGTACEA